METTHTFKLQVFAIVTLLAWLMTLKPNLGLYSHTPLTLTDVKTDIDIPEFEVESANVARDLPPAEDESSLVTQVASITTDKTDNTRAPVEVALVAATGDQTDKNEVLSAIIKYSREYGISTAKMLKIAECESGLNKDAVNGPYGGLYQFLASTWQSNRRAMGVSDDPTLRFNIEEAVKTAAYKMSKDGFGAWPVCSTI